MRVLFAGGGTGGHLFPAIAIAREIAAQVKDCRIEFVGTKYGIESRMSESIGYPLNLIAVRGLARELSLSLITFPIRLLIALFQTLGLFRRFRPDVVIGTGGYVAAPVLMVASWKRVPRVIQEQNSYPGLVTRKMSGRADIVLIAYKKALEYLPSGINYKVMGNPIRRTINSGNRGDAIRKFGLREGRTTILILGGSQGAHRINEAVMEHLDSLDDTVQILWQCGKRDYKEVAGRLENKEYILSLFPFTDDMEAVYAAADFAIARAGALTIAELMACGIPAILIPFPYATADHQSFNAREIEAAGAAVVIEDGKLQEVDIIAQAMDIIKTERFVAMRKAAAGLGQIDAARDIAQEIINLVSTKGKAA